MRLILLLFLFSSVIHAADTRHVLMVSDSRGNCSFAHGMIENFYSWEGTSFKLVSVGGSSPRTWVNEKRRILSPYGLTYDGNSAGPIPLPKYLKLRKIYTPLFKDLLKKEFKAKDDLQKLVVINMGYNAINRDDLRIHAKTMIQQVHDLGASCIWIGTPATARFRGNKSIWQTEELNKAIISAGPNDNGEHCKFIDSTKLTHYPFNTRSPQTDGIHYCWHPVLQKIGHSWADKSFELIKDSAEELYGPYNLLNQ